MAGLLSSQHLQTELDDVLPHLAYGGSLVTAMALHMGQGKHVRSQPSGVGFLKARGVSTVQCSA